MKTASKLSLNSLSNILAFGGSNVVSLFTLPTFLKAYGDDQYGIYILAFGVTSTLAMLDLGVKTSLTKFTAEFSEDGDKQRFSTAVLGSIFLSALLGLLFGAGVFALSFFVDNVFNVPAEYSDIARNVFRVAGLYTVIYVVSRVPQSILEGHQMFYWRNLSKLSSIVAVIIAFIIVRFTPFGLTFSFIGFVLWMMLSQLLPAICNSIIILRKNLLRGFSWQGGINRDVLFSEFMQFSGNLFLLQLIGIFAFQTDKLIVGAILTPAMVTILTVVTKPMFIARMVNNQTVLVFGPLFAKRARKGNATDSLEILRRGNLLIGVLMLPITAMLVILIQPFIDLYIGGEHSRFAYWGGIAGLVYVFSPFFGLVQRFMVYTDQVRQVRNISFWLVLANVVISVVGTFYFGIGGVVLGSLIQSMLGVIAYNWLFVKTRDIKLSSIYSPLGYINLLYVLVVGAGLYWFVSKLEIVSWWHFIGVGLICTPVLYAFGLAMVYRQRLWVAPK